MENEDENDFDKRNLFEGDCRKISGNCLMIANGRKCTALTYAWS